MDQVYTTQLYCVVYKWLKGLAYVALSTRGRGELVGLQVNYDRNRGIFAKVVVAWQYDTLRTALVVLLFHLYKVHIQVQVGTGAAIIKDRHYREQITQIKKL